MPIVFQKNQANQKPTTYELACKDGYVINEDEIKRGKLIEWISVKKNDQQKYKDKWSLYYKILLIPIHF